MSGFTEDQICARAREGYERGRASFAMLPETSALLVIDMQDEFVKPHWTPYWVPAATRMIPQVAALIAFCRAERMPIIHTAFAKTHEYLDRPASGILMANRVPVKEANPEWFREARVTPELAPMAGEIVLLKPSYGAFYDTPLETILRNLEVDTIIIAGTLSNYCCGMTARQGYERGFQVVFGSDVTATDDAELHEAELKVLRRGFARVMTAGEIVAEIDANSVKKMLSGSGRPS